MRPIIIARETYQHGGGNPPRYYILLSAHLLYPKLVALVPVWREGRLSFSVSLIYLNSTHQSWFILRYSHYRTLPIPQPGSDNPFIRFKILIVNRLIKWYAICDYPGVRAFQLIHSL
jgi:hypothetical protein